MACNFIPRDRDQDFLLPPSVAGWLPEGHMAWFVLDAVEGMDWARSTRSIARTGRAAPPGIRG